VLDLGGEFGTGIGWEYRNRVRLTAESNFFTNPIVALLGFGPQINALPNNPTGSIWVGGHFTMGVGKALAIPVWTTAVDVTLIPWMD